MRLMVHFTILTTTKTLIGSWHVSTYARKSGIGKFVESHNLTSYLPMFLLILEDSECASVVVQWKWLRGHKDYESNVLVLDFGWSYRWLNKGGYGTATQVVFCVQKIWSCCYGDYHQPEYINWNLQLYNPQHSPYFQLFLLLLFWIFLSSFFSLFLDFL
jgi:hypothetical protein